MIAKGCDSAFAALQNLTMTDEKRKDIQSLLDKLISVFSELPWPEIIRSAWKIIQKVIQCRPYSGMYEVLNYESTLELMDRGGEKATFKKREKVRYLQDNIIAYQDQAWGDGEILINYRCSPGTPVDRYRSGFKTYILISRREVKNKGDLDTFNIEWGIRQGFLRRIGHWETHVTHHTKYLKINVIFPKFRLPKRTTLIESNRQRSHSLGNNAQMPLPDGRWQVTWETHQPRLYENYVIQWQW